MPEGRPVPALSVHGLVAVFGEGPTRVEALRGVDLEVARGTMVAVMGASGSGKSTLLHLVAGLLAPTAGRVVVEGEDLATLGDDALTRFRRRRIGLVFQAFHLLPVMTARENVAMPLLLDGVGRDAALSRADELLERVGLSARRLHVPAELSGGEQQRVAIARALAADPPLLLADEPTGNLDSEHGREVLSLLRRLVAGDGRTLVLVTHDDHAAAVADRVVHLADGKVVADGAPPGRVPPAS